MTTKILGQLLWIGLVVGLAAGIYVYFFTRREVHATVTIPEDEVVVRVKPLHSGEAIYVD